MTIPDLLAKYREAAERTSDADPKIANEWARELHRCYKRLRDSKEGRAGITALTSHVNPDVRCWAAAHSLLWSPEVARPVLEALRDSDGPCSLDAKWTLREFDDGRLSFEH